MEPIMVATGPAPGPYIRRICQFTTHRQSKNSTADSSMSCVYSAITKRRSCTHRVPQHRPLLRY